MLCALDLHAVEGWMAPWFLGPLLLLQVLAWKDTEQENWEWKRDGPVGLGRAP